MRLKNPISLLLFFVFSCSDSSQHSQQDLSWHQINGRNSSEIYRVHAPSEWKKLNPGVTEFLEDTTKPICTYLIHEDAKQAIITIHNFPSVDDTRIPPRAQVTRWMYQLQPQEANAMNIIPQAFSGFVGLRFEGSGLKDNEPVMVLAWAMELASEHFLSLSSELQRVKNDQEAEEIYERRASYTIKAIGPESIISKHRQKLIAFARSFELIKELPEPL